jgi:hypothetical protein
MSTPKRLSARISAHPEPDPLPQILFHGVGQRIRATIVDLAFAFLNGPLQ